MPSRSSIDVVADLQQVAENIRRYQDDLAANADLVARMSRHPAWYALRRNNGRWLFGPSKFIGYAGITAQRYLGPYERSEGRETERVLNEWFRPVDPDSVLGRELDTQFREFFSRYGKIPHKLRRISVAKHEFGAEMGGHAKSALSATIITGRVSVDSKICGGRPCIRGTRVRVSDILDMISHGVSPDEIVRDYPYLKREDIAAALAYAARAVDHRVVKAA